MFTGHKLVAPACNHLAQSHRAVGRCLVNQFLVSPGGKLCCVSHAGLGCRFEPGVALLYLAARSGSFLRGFPCISNLLSKFLVLLALWFVLAGLSMVAPMDGFFFLCSSDGAGCQPIREMADCFGPVPASHFVGSCAAIVVDDIG